MFLMIILGLLVACIFLKSYTNSNPESKVAYSFYVICVLVLISATLGYFDLVGGECTTGGRFSDC